ncbi:MAG TPA: hypothetical protein VHV77_12355, partial [Pirellulales bacterium]|nr:hypothetical protein [Pirellulales bacterium]
MAAGSPKGVKLCANYAAQHSRADKIGPYSKADRRGIIGVLMLFAFRRTFPADYATYRVRKGALPS